MEHLLLSFASVMQSIGYVVLAIVVLLIMITVHEFGHYVAGKLLGFGIEEFAIGFGPKLYSKKAKSGEVFSVRALPIGGFCAFKGEDEEDDDPKAFNNRKPWQRIIVLISGALMNFLLALLLIFLLFGAYGRPAYVVTEREEMGFPSLGQIEESAILKEGDVILSMNGRRVYLATDLMRAIDDKQAGDMVPITVLRDGERTELNLRLHRNGEFTNIEDTEALLLALGLRSLSATNVRQGFFPTIGNGFEYSFRVAGTIFTVLGQLFTGKLDISSLGGTVTTVSVTASAIRVGGLNYLLMMASFIGVNLAVFNLLPIPALDGSRVVFTIIEWIRKKPMNRKVEAAIHFCGFVFLIGFAVLVDILQLF